MNVKRLNTGLSRLSFGLVITPKSQLLITKSSFNPNANIPQMSNKIKRTWADEEINGPIESVPHPCGVGWLETPYGQRVYRANSKQRAIVTNKAIEITKKIKTRFPIEAFW